MFSIKEHNQVNHPAQVQSPLAQLFKMHMIILPVCLSIVAKKSDKGFKLQKIDAILIDCENQISKSLW